MKYQCLLAFSTSVVYTVIVVGLIVPPLAQMTFTKACYRLGLNKNIANRTLVYSSIVSCLRYKSIFRLASLSPFAVSEKCVDKPWYGDSEQKWKQGSSVHQILIVGQSLLLKRAISRPVLKPFPNLFHRFSNLSQTFFTLSQPFLNP